MKKITPGNEHSTFNTCYLNSSKLLISLIVATGFSALKLFPSIKYVSSLISYLSPSVPPRVHLINVLGKVSIVLGPLTMK